MAKIKINLDGAELTIEFSDTKDLEDQLEKIDLSKINTLLDGKKQNSCGAANAKEISSQNIPLTAKVLGAVNLLKISEGGEDAMKLAIFLSANGASNEEIKKITGITILSS